MLYYLPIRYEDRRDIKKISELTVGEAGVTTGEVMASGETRYGRRRVFEAAISDSSGILIAKWFHFKGDYLKKRYTVGRKLLLYGTVKAFAGKKEMIHPDVEFLDGGGELPDTGGAGIVPIYSAIENFHQKTIRKLAGNVVNGFAGVVEGAVPAKILQKHGLMDIESAIKGAHAIFDDISGDDHGEAEARGARKSLVFDELFSLELSMAMKRRNIKKEDGISVVLDEKSAKLDEKLIESLDFELTDAQKRVIKEIIDDMEAPHPMNRLLQGDVGSGKTIVSLVSLLRAVNAGYQAVIMAPTEILAEQHFHTMSLLTAPFGVKPTLLTGKLKKSERNKVLEDISSGNASLIIGTHALIQKDVEFAKLGLVVIDEQHRFGVLQRARLRRAGARGIAPDILIMTATPIPRTLALTVFGDMDVSIIDELPKGRRMITTAILREKERHKAYSAVKAEVKKGAQAYIIYPLVEESEELPLKDATNMAEHLDTEIFPDFAVALIHGRMKSKEKEEIMDAFRSGEIDILVATTVVEVGVDVPNASLMLIEHAERFGLAQLHQLRGRVGRGERPSKCLLLAQWTASDDSYRRLKVMEETLDGFKIAEEDLKIRGPGDFLGARQSGLPDFRLAEALSDMSLLKAAREEAIAFLETDPDLKSEEGVRIARVIEARWKGRLELAEVG
jgi:ATP-dependent DNA helicase RecG